MFYYPYNSILYSLYYYYYFKCTLPFKGLWFAHKKNIINKNNIYIYVCVYVYIKNI